ncbi:D-aminoacylase [bacterium]|nr:D-aminoacylase [bacterium]
MKSLFSIFVSIYIVACAGAPDYDIIIRNGTIYDGSGLTPFVGDVAINADTIAAIGSLAELTAERNVDASGLAVAPGFINMLSWATESLIQDGFSQSAIRQGVTLEVFGEGRSMGPLSDAMKEESKRRQGEIQYDIEWTTLAEYLEYLQKRGVSTNVASFVGATTVRIHVLGYENRAPNPEELRRMQELVRQAMDDGALGVGSSLIYAPAFYAQTDELVALAKIAAEYDGMYISHIRDEGNQFLEALDELIAIARKAEIRTEIYHFKCKGAKNWPKLDQAIRIIEQAQDTGVEVGGNIYNYLAGSTGLNATMPPWVQEGGLEAWIERLKDPEIRERVAQEISRPAIGWNNNLELAGTPDNIVLVGFKSEELRPFTGKTLSEVAQMRGTSPVETAMDLVIEDRSRVGAVYFMMSEDNLKKKLRLPWVSFGSDAASLAPTGAFLKSRPHPRAYGNFARLLGKYVREEKIIPLEEAIRRLTSYPAARLRIKKRGALKLGHFADLAIFDPGRIQDHATFENPHQYATGMVHVFVNGQQVLSDGEHTGVTPGRVVRGPGWRG